MAHTTHNPNVDRDDTGAGTGAKAQDRTGSADHNRAEPQRSDRSASRRAGAPLTDFTDEHAETMLAYTRGATEAAVRNQSFTEAMPVSLDQAPAFGIFVTLRRATLLRACRGRWGQPLQPLGPLLAQVAHDTATGDPRFPSITEDELPLLNIDISVMFNPAMVGAKGEDRIEAIEVGKHGLVIDHPRGRGLLLPHVATEQGWDAKTFLDHLSAKAGLPPDTWRRDPAAQLMTFQTKLFTGPAPQPELDVQQLGARRLQQLLDAINLMLHDQPIERKLGQALTKVYNQDLGLQLQTESGSSAAAVGHNQSLIGLATACVRSLRGCNGSPMTDPQPVRRLSVLWEPIRLTATDYPSRHGLISGGAVVVSWNGQWHMNLDDRPTAYDRVGQALRSVRVSAQDWRAGEQRGTGHVTAFSVMPFESRERPNNVLARQPARAGQFYPADAREMVETIDRHLAVGQSANRGKPGVESGYRAVMLPHAGWPFCGDTIGKTLARVAVPETVIVIGPKHTPFGSAWSVPPHEQWNMPGSSVPIATDLIERLLELVPQLDCEPDAHQQEHGCEVLLPFLQRVQPNLRVVPMVMAAGSYESTATMARGLADLIAELDTPPLLVISSDMNHFAAEPENRRLDQMALDAMLTGHPQSLYNTCESHQISMCGMIPAVTVMQALAKTRPMKLELVDYTNSAQATGDTSRVVGYAGVLIE